MSDGGSCVCDTGYVIGERMYRAADHAVAQEALGHELFKHRDHRVPRDAELRRGSSGRRKPHARLEAAVEDRRTQTFVDLMVKRSLGAPNVIDARYVRLVPTRAATEALYLILDEETSS